MRFVITGILDEVWIQNVDNVVLSREITLVFVVAMKFFLSRLPRLWFRSYWDDIHMFVGCCIVSWVVMCLNTSLMLKKDKRHLPNVIELHMAKPYDCILV